MLWERFLPRSARCTCVKAAVYWIHHAGWCAWWFCKISCRYGRRLWIECNISIQFSRLWNRAVSLVCEGVTLVHGFTMRCWATPHGGWGLSQCSPTNGQRPQNLKRIVETGWGRVFQALTKPTSLSKTQVKAVVLSRNAFGRAITGNQFKNA